MIKIGITGSIASGKTTASKIISNQRGKLFSADKIVKKFRAILYLNRGDYVQAGYPGVGSSSGNTSFSYSKNYAFFQGYLLST